MIPVLRRAADHGLELACDNMSKWDDDIRAQVLAASRIIVSIVNQGPGRRRPVLLPPRRDALCGPCVAVM